VSTNLLGTRAVAQFPMRPFSSVRRGWHRGLAFFVGFSMQFDILIGGGGEGASATGGFGYRLIDFVALGTVALLAVHAFAPRRILSVGVYTVVVLALFAMPTMGADSRTSILSYHYMLYSLSALYVVAILNQAPVLDRFCWGLTIGLVATVPVFIIQDSSYAPQLLELGLTPGYTPEFAGIVRDTPRFAGLWGHPNEAGHVAALSAAAAGYLALVRRQLAPLVIVAACLLAVFYYSWSRGGLMVGGAILALPLLIAGGRASLPRLAIMCAILAAVFVVALQFDFVAARFGDDANGADNLADRLASVWAGVRVVLANPFGMSFETFLSAVGSESGGVLSPHNGFIFFGGIFGLLPLVVLLVTFTANLLRVRSPIDVFFALFTLQVTLSFLFEQLPGSYSYALPICLIGARAFVRTPTGGDLLVRLPPVRLATDRERPAGDGAHRTASGLEARYW
jgi:hypothetical protein